MNLVVFSDIHGNLKGFLEFKKYLKDIPYDKIIFLGDVFGYYYEQNDVLRELHEMKDLIWIKGNHDENFLKSLKDPGLVDNYIEKYGHSYSLAKDAITDEDIIFISNLPDMAEFETDGIRIGAFHGTPSAHLEGRLYPDKEVMTEEIPDYEKYDLIFLGHTHCRMEKRVGKTLVINPGSVGQPRDGRGHSFVVVDTDKMKVSFYEYHMDYSELYKQIDLYDPTLSKLKEVLERKAK